MSWQQEHNVTSASLGPFRSALSPWSQKVGVSLQCQTCYFHAGKMGGVFGNVLPSAKWHLRIFYIKAGVLGRTCPGKCVRESGECQPAAVAYAKAGVKLPW